MAGRKKCSRCCVVSLNICDGDVDSFDWPDQLGFDLACNPKLRIAMWARLRGLADATVSRGFYMVYGVTPSAFRAHASAFAWRQLITRRSSLTEIALEAGFSDQSHMTRAVRAITGQLRVPGDSTSNRFKTWHCRRVHAVVMKPLGNAIAARSTSRLFAILSALFFVSLALAERLSDTAGRRTAAGGDAWNSILNLTYEAKETSSGMAGHARSLEKLKSGHIRREADFKIVHFLDVWNATHHWRQNMTGGVHALNSDFAQQVNATDRWLAQRAWLTPGVQGAALEAVQEHTESGARYEVIGATPSGGQRVELWFDANTHLLARTVRVMPDHD